MSANNNSTVHESSPFDSYAADYDRWFEEEAGKIIFATEVRAFKKILHLLPKPWLEIGVGSGRFARELGIMTGLDPSGNLLKIARNRGIITIKGKAEDRILPADSFGTIFLIMTMCFIESPGIALQQIHCSLKPGGKVVFGVVPAESPWAVLYQKKKQAGHPLYSFANFRTYAELQSLLRDSGFTIDSVISTLFQYPDHLTRVEDPMADYSPDAGFLVIVARKK